MSKKTTVKIFTGEVFTGTYGEIVDQLRGSSFTPGEDAKDFMVKWAMRVGWFSPKLRVSSSSAKAFVESQIALGMFVVVEVN